jgi:hypothetical protein
MNNLPEIKSELVTSSELDEKVAAGITKASSPDDEADIIAKNTKSSGRCCCGCCGRKKESDAGQAE